MIGHMTIAPGDQSLTTTFRVFYPEDHYMLGTLAK
jgi:hypothetical protein